MFDTLLGELHEKGKAQVGYFQGTCGNPFFYNIINSQGSQKPIYFQSGLPSTYGSIDQELCVLK